MGIRDRVIGQARATGHVGRVTRSGRLWAVILLIAVSGSWPVSAADVENVSLMVGRSIVIDTGSPIHRVSLTSDDVADALVTSSAQLLVHGKTPGTISMFVWDRAGAIRRYDVTVARDLSRLATQVRDLFPGERISVEGNGRSIVVAGMRVHEVHRREGASKSRPATSPRRKTSSTCCRCRMPAPAIRCCCRCASPR